MSASAAAGCCCCCCCSLSSVVGQQCLSGHWFMGFVPCTQCQFVGPGVPAALQHTVLLPYCLVRLYRTWQAAVDFGAERRCGLLLCCCGSTLQAVFMLCLRAVCTTCSCHAHSVQGVFKPCTQACPCRWLFPALLCQLCDLCGCLVCMCCVRGMVGVERGALQLGFCLSCAA